MGDDFLGNFVAFEHVLQGADLEAVVVGDAHQHEDLVGAVAVRVDVAAAFENFLEGLHLEVFAGRDAGFFRVVSVPLGLVDFGIIEGLADDIFHAHAGGGIAALLGLSIDGHAGGVAGALGIFAEGELDAGGGAFEDQALGVLAPTHFDGQGFAADGVGGAVENVGGGDAAGEGAVDGDVLGIEDVADIHHGGDADAAFVDTAIDGDVGVAIDDAGDDVLIGGVDDLGAGGLHDLLADFGDFTVLDEDGAFEGALGDRHHGGVLDDVGLGAQGRGGEEGCEEGVFHG